MSSNTPLTTPPTRSRSATTESRLDVRLHAISEIGNPEDLHRDARALRDATGELDRLVATRAARRTFGCKNVWIGLSE
jgi:hypothetical protein